MQCVTSENFMYRHNLMSRQSNGASISMQIIHNIDNGYRSAAEMI